MNRWLMFTLLILLASPGMFVRGQDGVRAGFTAEIGAPLIGQPIELLLTVDAPANVVVAMPTFSDNWPPFAIRQIGDVDVVTDAGRTIYQQRLTVILWGLGDYQTPPTQVEYQIGGEPHRIDVQPAYFVVQSVLNPDDLNLRPLKPPVSMFYVSPFAAIGVAFAVLVLGVFAWSKRTGIRLPAAAEVSVFHAAALVALAEFRKMRGPNVAPSQVYENVSNALRHYIQGRFSVSAEELTTQELMSNLTDLQNLSDRRKRELGYLLERADLVKFARMQPQPKSAEKILTVAQQWVTAVEQDYSEDEAER